MECMQFNIFLNEIYISDLFEFRSQVLNEFLLKIPDRDDLLLVGNLIFFGRFFEVTPYVEFSLILWIFTLNVDLQF